MAVTYYILYFFMSAHVKVSATFSNLKTSATTQRCNCWRWKLQSLKQVKVKENYLQNVKKNKCMLVISIKLIRTIIKASVTAPKFLGACVTGNNVDGVNNKGAHDYCFFFTGTHILVDLFIKRIKLKMISQNITRFAHRQRERVHPSQ